MTCPRQCETTLVQMQAVFENVKTAIRALFGSLFTSTLTESLTKATKNFQSFGKTIGDFVTKIKASEDFQKLAGAFQKVAGFLITAGSAAGELAGAFLSLQSFTGILAPITYGLELFGSLISGLPGEAAKTFTQLTHSVFTGVSVFELLGDTVKEIRGIFAGTGTFLSKFSAVAKVIFGNFASYVDTFFLGLPTQIVKSFVQGVDKEKATFRGAVMGIMDFAYAAMKEQLAEWATSIPNNLNVTWGVIGRSAGEQLGNIAKRVSDFISNLFSSKDNKTVKEKAHELFSGIGAEGGTITASLYEIGRKVISGVTGILSSFANGFLAPFGTNISLVFDDVELTFKEFASSAISAWTSFKGGLITVYDTVLPLFKGLGQAVLSLANGMITAANLASDVANATSIARLKFLEAQASVGAYTDASIAELLTLRKQEADRAEGFKLMHASIDKAKTSLSEFNQIGSEGTKKKEEELKAQNDSLANERKSLDYQKSKFALISSISRGERDVGSAIAELIATKKFELIPEVMKAAFDVQKDAADRAAQAQDNLNKKLDDKTKPPSAVAPGKAEPSKEDISSKYSRVVATSGEDFAQYWLLEWARRGLSGPSPHIPEKEGGGAAPASPTKAGEDKGKAVTAIAGNETTGKMPTSVTEEAKPASTPNVPAVTQPQPSVSPQDAAQMIATAVGEAIVKASKEGTPIHIHIDIDPEKMKQLIITTSSEQAMMHNDHHR